VASFVASVWKRPRNWHVEAVSPLLASIVEPPACAHILVRARRRLSTDLLVVSDTFAGKWPASARPELVVILRRQELSSTAT